MSGKFNINLKEIKEHLQIQGEEDRHIFSPEDLEKFKIAAEILAQNEKDCEQFKGRDGI
jgi:hypothetical protein